MDLRLAAAVAAAALAGCAGPRLAPPSGVDRGALVARVQVRGSLLRFLHKDADAGVARKLDASGAPEPGGSIASSWGEGGVVLFADLPPGRYTLASASFRARGARYIVRLPDDGEAARAVTLRPGKAAFLGDYVYDGEWPEDPWRRAALIVLHWLTPWRKRPLLERGGFFRQQDPGAEAEARVMRQAAAALQGTAWGRLAEARVLELGSPEPAKRVGLRGRELPLRPETILSWRDTLEWGEPRRARAGLEWRRPEGDARIAVFFTSATAPGFAGFEEAERELRRAAAGSVEDSGDVYDVRVATRTGRAATTTTYRYPEGTLTGAVTLIERTETVLVPDRAGLYTARLRAPRDRFGFFVPLFHEFLLQLVLGPPPPKAASRRELVMPGGLP